jgi:solute:Na+ symporter, SSS family
LTAALTGLDVVVLVAYLAAVVGIGAAAGGRRAAGGGRHAAGSAERASAHDYFLAGGTVPAWAVCFSIVATETSALTFISVPATAYTGDLWFLQLPVGYLLGRIAVAWLLLPRYFSGDLVTAYELLERRFGLATRRFASIIFMITRAFADSVRVFAAAIPIALITGLAYWQSILLAGLATLLYTYHGGLRAVIRVDVLQLLLYLGGGLAALYVLAGVVPGGLGGIVTTAADAGKLRVLHFDGGFASSRWLLTGVVGGAFLSMASHGVDHLIVQRLLAAGSLGAARRALIGSGVIVLAQMALFLMIGLALFAHYEARVFAIPDEVFPRFIIEGLPSGLSGLMVAGILAAMMSTVSSSLNSLASASTHDLYAPARTPAPDERALARAGRAFTLAWAAVLIGGALLFQLVQQGTPLVVVALQIASFTYGGLLGGFLLAVLSQRADQRDALLGMSSSIAAMTVLWAAQQFGIMPRMVDGLWFALIGSAVAVAVGSGSAALRSRA